MITRISNLLNVLLLVGFAAVFLSVAFVIFYVRPRLARPLRDVTSALRSLAEGRTELGTLRETGWEDEVSDLSRAAARFRQSVIERQAANDSLPQEVERHRVTLSELRATQESLVHAGKLAVLGEMSAGLNHELNQPLMSMQHHLHALRDIVAQQDNAARWTACCVCPAV